MRLHNSIVLAIAAILLFCHSVSAQFPNGAAGGAAAGGAPAGAAGTAQQAGTIWSKLGLSQEKLAVHKARFCKSGLGRLMKSMFAPIKMATGGGLLPPCCPDVLSQDELNKLKPEDVSASESTAAKIKADEAKAKERIAAVKYLATVDCHYWPEAEEALITALRADRNECVRYAAAQALAQGCCCTKKTVEALQITVSGSEKDGNPYEKSERVKQLAFFALHQCIARMSGQVIEPQPPEPPLAEPPEKSAALKGKSEVQQASWIKKIRENKNAKEQVLKDALRAYASNVGTAKRQPGTKRTPQNILDLWKAANRTSPPELPSVTRGPDLRQVGHESTLRPIGETPLVLPEYDGQKASRER